MSTNYLIDEILPARRVHLLGGPSGVGKTRWLFDTLLKWEAGKPIFGLASHPVPWVYVPADRDLESVEETLATMGIKKGAIDIIPAFGRHAKTWSQITTAAAERGAELVVVEALAGFCDAPGLHHQVRAFLNSVYTQIYPTINAPRGMTIMGVMETPKMKPHERYENPRQRISGVATWAHSTETIMMLEPADPKHPKKPERILHICPRNARAQELSGKMDLTGHVIF